MVRPFIDLHKISDLKFNLQTKYGNFAALLVGSDAVYLQVWSRVLDDSDWKDLVNYIENFNGDVEIRGIAVRGTAHVYRSNGRWACSGSPPYLKRAGMLINDSLPRASFNELIGEIERALNQYEADHPEMLEANKLANALSIHNDLRQAECNVEKKQKELDDAKATVANLERQLNATGVEIEKP